MKKGPFWSTVRIIHSAVDRNWEKLQSTQKIIVFGVKIETGNVRTRNSTANLRLILSSQSQVKNINYGSVHNVATTKSILNRYILEQVFPAGLGS